MITLLKLSELSHLSFIHVSWIRHVLDFADSLNNFSQFIFKLVITEGWRERGFCRVWTLEFQELAEQKLSGVQGLLYSSVKKIQVGVGVGKYSMEVIQVYRGLMTGGLNRLNWEIGFYRFKCALD
jgi:hypothetical protein